MTDSRRTPPICHDRHERDLTALLAQYGGAAWMLDDDPATVAKTGQVRELSGLYPGAVSGVTYYNQVTVTGTLNPDATGTYTAAGVHNGVPYYRRADGAWYISWTGTQGRISIYIGGGGTQWYCFAPAYMNTTYAPLTPATGTATVTNVTASGIYRFDPSGVTFGQPGPVLGGDLKAALSFAAGSVSIGTAFDPSGAFSVGAWVNCANPSGATEQCVFGLALSSAKRFTVSIASDTLRAGYNNGTTSYPKSGAFTAGWHHVLAAKAAGNNAPALYVDGVALTGTTAPTFSNTAAGRFAQRNDATLGITGSLSNGFVLPAELTSNGVYALYNGAIGG